MTLHPIPSVFPLYEEHFVFFFISVGFWTGEQWSRTPTNTNTVLCKIGHAMPSCIKHQVYSIQGLSISGLAGAFVQESDTDKKENQIS
jgi:hypothetical protein